MWVIEECPTLASQQLAPKTNKLNPPISTIETFTVEKTSRQNKYSAQNAQNTEKIKKNGVNAERKQQIKQNIKKTEIKMEEHDSRNSTLDVSVLAHQAIDQMVY